MKVSCPVCSQHFNVPDAAIGPGGRTLRCSKCGHEWHQHPPETAETVMAMAGGEEAPLAGRRPGKGPGRGSGKGPGRDMKDEAGDRVVPFARFGSGEADPDAPTPTPTPAPTMQEEGFGEDFGTPPLPRGRLPLARKPERHYAKMAAISIVLVLLGGLGTLFGARAALVGAWPPLDRLYTMLGLGVPVIGEGLVIQNVAARRRAEDAVEFLDIRGEIRNPTGQLQSVPTLAGTLRGAGGDILQEWLFRAENQVILPGEKTVFEYELPQPGADAAEVTVTFSAATPGGDFGY